MEGEKVGLKEEGCKEGVEGIEGGNGRREERRRGGRGEGRWGGGEMQATRADHPS
jgi:hypothetical protein